MILKPLYLDLNREECLTIQWSDGTTNRYPIAYLRKMSPSAEAKKMREEMANNPLTVLPQSMSNQSGPLTALDAELVGNYAIRIRFSDGNDTGIFSWQYLREIAPESESAEPSGETASP